MPTITLGIGAAAGDQAAMRAALDHPAPVEHDDLVAVADRRQAVGDDDAGQAAPSDRLEHFELGDRIERAGRLIEHEQRRIGGERLGQLQPLPLAAREIGARPRPPRRRNCPAGWR